jgi:EmrB/QacA subfamily drug resistance transporter
MTPEVIAGGRRHCELRGMTTTSARAADVRWAPLAALLAGAFMVVLDFFIVNVALPSIGSELGAGASSLEWVVAGYGLAFAAFLITSGRLGDELGRRRVYCGGIALFTAASGACAAAPSPTTLVLARVVQGLAAALVMPQVLATIGAVYRGPHYVRALSIYGVALGLAAVGGQLIGGALLEADLGGLGWRWCFLINLPIGALALVATPRVVPDSRAEQPARIDGSSVALAACGLTATLFPLIEGRQHGWPAWTFASFAAAAVLLAAFVARQQTLAARGASPLLDLGLFAERTFTAGLATQLFLAVTQASFFVYLALYLQLGRGLDPLESGLAFGIVAVAYVAASGPAPALTARFGRRTVAAGGGCLSSGLAMLAVATAELGTGGSLVAFAPGLALAGAGIGLCFTPLTATVLAHVDPARAGAASGALATTQQVGFALGVAITGVIFFRSGHDVAGAFQASLVELTLTSAGIVAMTRALPGRTRRLPAAAAGDPA